MSVDSDQGDSTTEMEKINVRVPVALLERIDEEWEQQGYASKSEFIRDALRTAVDPPVKLSAETLEDLAESREQAERGDTCSPEEVRERLGIDD